MDEHGKQRHSTDTPLFDDDFIFDAIPEETKQIESDLDPELDIPQESVETEEPQELPELSRGEQQLASYKEAFLRDLRKHANMEPKFKSKVYYFGKMQRLSTVMQNLAKRVRQQNVGFTLEQLEVVRKQLEDEGYAAGPPIDLGIEAARRVVVGPDANETSSN